MIGKERWLGRVKELGRYLRDGLKKLENVDIISSHNEELCAGLTTYKVKNFTGPELQKTLWEREAPTKVCWQGVDETLFTYLQSGI